MNLRMGGYGMAVSAYNETLDFGDMKKSFRGHIDATYDHQLLLNEADPWAQAFYVYDNQEDAVRDGKTLPGLVSVPGDPTIENLCRWIGIWAAEEFKNDVIIRIDETSTNGAEAYVRWDGFQTVEQV
jgi:6-pyruvoyl-tetrahydropterin synthase